MKGLKKGALAVAALGVAAAGTYFLAHNQAVAEAEAALETFRDRLPEGSTLAYQGPEISLLSRTATVNGIQVTVPEDRIYTVERLTVQVDGEVIEKAELTEFRIQDPTYTITATAIHIEDAHIPAFGPEGLDWYKARLALGEAINVAIEAEQNGIRSSQTIGRYTLRGLRDGRLEVFEGVDLVITADPDLNVTGKSMRMGGLHIGDMMDASRRLEDRLADVDLSDDTQVMEMTPELQALQMEFLGTFLRSVDSAEVEDFTMQLPDVGDMSLQSYRLTLGERGADGLPNHVAVALEGLRVPVDDEISAEVRELLTKAEVRDPTLSFRATLRIDPEQATAVLDPVSIEVSPVVRVSTGLRVNGIASLDIAKLLEGLDAVALVDASLNVTDLGAMKKILGHEAEARGVPVEHMATEMALTAGLAVASFFPDQGEAAMAAVQGLLTERESLEILVKPQGPVPLAALLVAPQDLGFSVRSY